MTLDEAIERYTSNAEYERTHGSLQGCMDFKQLAEWLTDYKRLKECYEVLPLVTPQPKIGHWIEENINEWSRKVFCSECGCSSPFKHVSNGDIYSASGYGVNNKTKYCPNCGAKMQEEEG